MMGWHCVVYQFIFSNPFIALIRSLLLLLSSKSFVSSDSTFLVYLFTLVGLFVGPFQAFLYLSGRANSHTDEAYSNYLNKG